MVTVRSSEVEMRPDPSRVVARAFLPGEGAFAGGTSRVETIAERAMSVEEIEAEKLLAQTRASFAARHPDLESVWEQNVATAQRMVPWIADVEGDRRALLGAYFTQEYAPESAAVCNPSMVPAPGADDGGFVMSVRAIGEGHISSVEFRTGKVGDDGMVSLDPPDPHLSLGERSSPLYDKPVFRQKLLELDADASLVETVMDLVADRFTASDLDGALEVLGRGDVSSAAAFETRKLAHWLASSNYQLSYPSDVPISRQILLPSSPAESRGIEDARFVLFEEEDGEQTYYATYTAYDGFTILPQLIETGDFSNFKFSTLNGSCARNKGMSLFPRRVEGLYAALGRHDQESLHLMRSDRLRVWNHAELITSPRFGWEAVQIGTCGSPIETPFGWIVLTHGVGPMRRYTLGALLLDLDDPSILVGRLDSPLLEPAPDERDGYVPNVVYSCGGMVRGDWLVIPYGFADQNIRFVSVSVSELIAEMG